MASRDIKDVLSKSSKLASYTMILQLSTRILTFLLNAVTLRYISKDALGIVNVRLVLLYNTILFLSREAFRRACLSHLPEKRQNERYKEDWRKLMNLLWCIFPVGMVFSSILSYIWIYQLDQPDPNDLNYYSTAVVVFTASVLCELFAEPLFIVAQSLQFIKLRVLSEGIPMIFKCSSIVIFLVLFPDLGIMSFCIAQAIFSITYVLIIYSYFIWYIKSGSYHGCESFPFDNPTELLPDFSQPRSAINTDTALLVWSFFKQSILKQILTESEKYVMTFFNILTFGDQGVYDAINNLGSLAARFIFLPIEESFYIFFSKMLDRGVGIEKQDKEKIRLCKHVLFCLLRLVFLIGLTILSFGYSYSYLFLHLYGGSILSEGSGPSLLRTYSLYVLLLAVNGITECFYFAAMSREEVDRYNKKMLVFSLTFLLSSYYLTSYLGSVGFIFSNCLNMGVRIGYSMQYIRRYFGSLEDSPLRAVYCNPIVFICYATTFGVCSLSEVLFWDYSFPAFALMHTCVGTVCLLGLLAVLITTEKDVVEFLKVQYMSRKKTD